MKEEKDVFKKFQDSFKGVEGHYHILEQRIPVEVQMEYFRVSAQVAKEKWPMDDEAYEHYVATMQNDEAMLSYKKRILAALATSKQVRAYRLLEKFIVVAPEDLRDWTAIALMEGRIQLESELSEEKQIYISTGLGGKEGKLRFFVLLGSKGGMPFQDYQKKTIEREFSYALPLHDCEIERLTVKEHHVEMLLLVPVLENLKDRLDEIVHECNLYGNFLSLSYTITNVKELSAEEIEEIFRKEDEKKVK
ncbi:hypothetical protein [Parabacteroides sp. Marseille-P3160]|uniref:hypothetical protein n=1 Tax=Parabacteroides sp. Marseille-P3160 TaxID=1917887 RepID=UPI0009BB2390|nr:hypothetical protein [Parabacteroides sp. Marseille-P3160]